MMLTVIVGFVALLLGGAAVVDFRARRRRIGLHGVDGEAGPETLRRAEADVRLRSNYHGPTDFNGGL